MSTIYGWLKSVSKGVKVTLQYVHESHVEWAGEADGRRFELTSTILFGPGYSFDAEETIDAIMEKAVSAYITVTELSSGRRYQGELINGTDEDVKVDYGNVTFLGRSK